MHGIGIGNRLGATIFFSFIALGAVIGFYLMFVKEHDKPARDKD